MHAELRKLIECVAHNEYAKQMHVMFSPIFGYSFGKYFKTKATGIWVGWRNDGSKWFETKCYQGYRIGPWNYWKG